jgi:hypothetical protein
MRSERTIAPGQVYRESYPPHLKWRVVRVVQIGLDDVPHAAIQRVDDKSATKLISCQILSDKRSYRAVVTTPAYLDIPIRDGGDRTDDPTPVAQLRPDPHSRSRPA